MSHTVLYIEPEALNVQLIKKLIKYEAYDILDVATGKSGLLMAQLHKPGLILMELTLPDIDAHDLIASFKASDMLCHIPILIYTTNLLYDSYQRCMSAGCVGHLNKPISKTNLLKAFQQFMPLSQAH